METRKVIIGILSVIFFIFYYYVLLRIWNSLVPFNATMDVISMFIFIFINIPLSVISAQTVIKIIKKS